MKLNEYQYYDTVYNQIQSTESIDELISKLYDHQARFLTDNQIKELGLPNNYLDLIRYHISKWKARVPLYDIRTNHIFLIPWENVYQRIFYDGYRFISLKLVDSFFNKDQPSKYDEENIRFISYYHLKTLKKTYLKIFYSSFELDSFITICRRPSFTPVLDHISPYYNLNELNYLAYDWGLIKKITTDPDDIDELCQKVGKYDIPNQILLEHQLYIYQSKAIGLVKYYSLYGSYYMNSYLRRTGICLDNPPDLNGVTRNLYLENQIKIMMKLVDHSPAFSVAHTVYRFVENDYLAKLNKGDIYQDPSFVSTTRNPFYLKENYAFGKILVKIKIPAGIKGAGLCIESYSNFPSEEEIILSPGSKFLVENVNDHVENTQFHEAFNLEVSKKYEFLWIGTNEEKMSSEMPDADIPNIKVAELREIINNQEFKHLPITERLKYFKDTYLNQNNQFSSIVGDHQYTFSVNAYDSSSVYRRFFYLETENGIMVTTANPKYGNINLMIEIGPEMHVNYYFKYSVTDPSQTVDINRPEWISWLSMFAYVLGIRSVIIHSNYTLQINKDDSPEEEIMKTRFTFSQNIYAYMKHHKKMYEQIEIVTLFDYSQFDRLKDYPIFDLIKSSDRNELFRIAKESKLQNLYELYLYIVEKYPKYLSTMENKLSEIYGVDENPFTHLMYNLNAWLYLYDRYLISYLPSSKNSKLKKSSFKKMVGDNKIVKFKNRLRGHIPTG